MTDRIDTAALRALHESFVKDTDGKTWTISGDACREMAGMFTAMYDALPELMRVYQAVAEAPEGFVVGQSGPDGFFLNHSGAIVQMDDPASVKGKRVRLVPSSGEG